MTHPSYIIKNLSIINPIRIYIYTAPIPSPLPGNIRTSEVKTDPLSPTDVN